MSLSNWARHARINLGGQSTEAAPEILRRNALLRLSIGGSWGVTPIVTGASGYTEYLKAGPALEDVIGEFLSSPEFRARMMKQLVPPARLPDLTSMMPDRY